MFKTKNHTMMASTQTTNSLNKQTTELLVSMFEKLSPLLNMDESLERIRPAINALREGKCTLVVIGEIKKGKSSLINALLGLKNVLPVSSDVATATVFRVVYGPKRRNIVVLRSKQDSETEVNPDDITVDYIVQENGRLANRKMLLRELEVSDEELALYGTEDGNPRNDKGVDHIRIEVPSEILKSGLEIIDTPGLGGLMKLHADITWSYIPNANAVLFVLESVQSPFTKDEQIFLEKIKKATPLIVFAQTKIDVVDTAKWSSWQERNLEEISKILEIPQEEVPYFPVSSEDKQIFIEDGKDGNPADYASSGFGPLENYVFNRLLKLHEQVSCLGVLNAMDGDAAQKESELVASFEIVRADTAKLAVLSALYFEKQKEFAAFEADELPVLITKLQDTFNAMIKEGEKELNDFLLPNQVNPVVDDFIGKIRGMEGNPKVIREQIDELQSMFTDICSKQAHEIFSEHRQRIAGFVDSELGRLDARLRELCVPADDSGNDSNNAPTTQALSLTDEMENLSEGIRTRPVDFKFSTYSYARSVFMGASFGGTASMMIVSVLTLNPIVIPVAIVLGAILSSKDVSDNRRREIIQHFQQALPGILLQIQKRYARQYSDVMNDIRLKVRDEQNRLVKTMKKQMSDRLIEISEQRKNEGLSVEQRTKQLSQDLKEIQRIRAGIRQAAGKKS